MFAFLFAVLSVALSVALTVGLTGCVDAPPLVKSAPVITGERAGISAGQDDVVLTGDWWKSFGNSQLTQLIETALRDNPGLKVAQARMQIAQAGVALSQADAGLKAGAAADARRQRFSGTGLVPVALAGETRSLANIQADVTWELDFFGRHEASLKSALGVQRAARAEAQAARVLLATDIARHYVRLAHLLDERRLAGEQVDQREALRSLVSRRLKAGLDTAMELRLAQGPPAQIRQRIEALDGQIALARHALAALTAQAPVALGDASPTLESLQAVNVPAIMPANLLGRRADVRAARWRVEAASQQLELARTDYRPNINLIGLAGLSSIGLDRIFSLNSRQYGIGPAISLPIFDSGRLGARFSGRAEELNLAVETYNQSVFAAVRDVADQISLLQSLARQTAEQDNALKAARAALEINRGRFAAGLVNRLAVVAAEAAVLEQRMARLVLDAEALDTKFALIRALGGGYLDEAT